jgi:hypothetical protein
MSAGHVDSEVGSKLFPRGFEEKEWGSLWRHGPKIANSAVSSIDIDSKLGKHLPANCRKNGSFNPYFLTNGHAKER